MPQRASLLHSLSHSYSSVLCHGGSSLRFLEMPGFEQSRNCIRTRSALPVRRSSLRLARRIFPPDELFESPGSGSDGLTHPTAENPIFPVSFLNFFTEIYLFVSVVRNVVDRAAETTSDRRFALFTLFVRRRFYSPFRSPNRSLTALSVRFTSVKPPGTNCVLT